MIIILVVVEQQKVEIHIGIDVLVLYVIATRTGGELSLGQQIYFDSENILVAFVDVFYVFMELPCEDVIVILWIIKSIGRPPLPLVLAALVIHGVEGCAVDELAQRTIAHEVVGADRKKLDMAEVTHHCGRHQVDVVGAQVHDP